MQPKNILNISFQRLDVDLNAQSDYSKLGRLNFCKICRKGTKE